MWFSFQRLSLFKLFIIKQQQQQQQQQQNLVPNFWDQLWILDKLVRVSHMFIILYLIQFATPLVNIKARN